MWMSSSLTTLPFLHILLASSSSTNMKAVKKFIGLTRNISLMFCFYYVLVGLPCQKELVCSLFRVIFASSALSFGSLFSFFSNFPSFLPCQALPWCLSNEFFLFLQEMQSDFSLLLLYVHYKCEILYHRGIGHMFPE